MSDDVEAIKQLKARYFRLIDTKDWDGLAAVFTDDVVIDVSGEGGGVTRGATEFVSFLRSVIGNAITVHHGHTPEIEVTSPTTARGIWALEDQLWWPEGGPVGHLHGFGHYHETYEKTDAGWRIKSLTITRLHRLIDR
ncbi:MAG TPA: nuclear transport factor 2 family protein [Acidimicrobiia bacterium]|nr:nuclear transport factor 2 family protein [Acidimicrobiia bacterium]